MSKGDKDNTYGYATTVIATAITTALATSFLMKQINNKSLDILLKQNKQNRNVTFYYVTPNDIVFEHQIYTEGKVHIADRSYKLDDINFPQTYKDISLFVSKNKPQNEEINSLKMNYNKDSKKITLQKSDLFIIIPRYDLIKGTLDKTEDLTLECIKRMKSMKDMKE